MPLFVCIAQIIIILFIFAFPVISAENEESSFNEIENLRNEEVAIVTGASKYQQELTDAPASVTVISSDDIRKGGYRNLAEVLNGVRGFYTLYNRSYHLVGAQGFSPLGDLNTRILLLIDGHRLNDAIYEQAPLGSDFPVDIDLIDQIEVIRGPGASLYGANAFLAVINVITKNGRDMKGGELSSSGGSYNAWTGRVTGGGKSANGADLLLSGSYRNTAGKQRISIPEYTTNGGISQGLDGETSWDMLAKATWKRLSLIVLHQTRDKDVPNAPYFTIFNERMRISDRHTLAGLVYNWGGGFADVNARLTCNHYEYRGDYPLDNEGARTLNRDAATGDWIGSDVYASKNIGEHLLTVGMEHRWQFTQRQRNFNVTPVYNSILDNNHRNFIQGYYLQDEYHITRNLILNAGLRLDNHDNFGSVLNPRTAIIWKPYDNTVLRLSYGEAFRAPNAYELYYEDKSSAKGNPGLKPEKLRSARLEWDQFIGNNIRTTVAGFHTGIMDLLEQTIDPTDGMMVFKNQGRAESNGIELQAEGAWENGVRGCLSYTYQATRNLDTNKTLENSPRTIAKASLTVPLPLPKKLFATVQVLYGGSRLNAAGESIAGAAVVNLTLLGRNLLEGLDIYASVYNLFDTRYSMPASSDYVNSLSESMQGIRQDGITFRIKATWRF